MKVVRVEGRDVVCQAQNDSELSGLLTVLHDSSDQASTGGGLNLTDLPLLSQSDVNALKCAERQLPLRPPLLLPLLVLLPLLLLLLLLPLLVLVLVLLLPMMILILSLLLANGSWSQLHKRFWVSASRSDGLIRVFKLSAGK